MEYLMVSNISLLVFYALYFFGFKRLTFFYWNRCYLLMAVLGAYVLSLPLLLDGATQEVHVPLTVLHAPLLERGPVVAAIEATHRLSDQLVYWLSLGYWLGVGVSLLLLLYRLVCVVKDRNNSNPYFSYAFFNRIRLGEKASKEPVIRHHELLHAKSGHSYDLLLLEIFQLFNWFNPIFYFLKRELKLQQEYWVDGHFSNQRIAYAEKLLAFAMRTPVSHFTHRFSNQSVLKERIAMLFKVKSRPVGKAYYFVFIPIAFSILLFSMGGAAYSSAAAGSVNALYQSPKPSNETAMGQEAQDPGGFDAFRMEVAQNIHYPDDAIEAGAKGRVEVSFVVYRDGEVRDIQLVQDIGYGLGEAVIEALCQSRERAGEMHQRPVSQRYLLPVQIDLSTNHEGRIESEAYGS